MKFESAYINIGNYDWFSENKPVAIGITNSGTDSVNAYVYFEYDNTSLHSGFLLSTSYSGTYTGYDDSVCIGQEKDYRFTKGDFDNTSISVKTGNVVLSDPGLGSGIYTSPVISTYNYIDVGYSVVDNIIKNNTNVRVYYRGSNIEPESMEEVWWLSSREQFTRTDLNCLDKQALSDNATPVKIFISPTNYLVYMQASNNYLYAIDYNNLVSDPSVWTTMAQRTPVQLDYDTKVDDFGNIWGYYDSILYKFDAYLVEQMAFTGTFGAPNWLFDFALTAEVGGAFWYTDVLVNTLNYANQNDGVLKTIYMDKPRALCETNSDHGCWVFDSITKRGYRYDKEGELLKSVYVGIEAYSAVSDRNDGFWVTDESYIIHMNSKGETLLHLGDFGDIKKIMVGYRKVLVYHEKSSTITIIDHITGETLNFFGLSGHDNEECLPALLSESYESAKKLPTINVPYYCDPVWGDVGSLSWTEIDNVFSLPRFKYHQFRLELISEDGISSPELKNIKITKGIKVESILKNETRYFYVKNNIKGYVEEGSYNTNLKCLWSSV